MESSPDRDLRSLREGRGLTLREAARALGVDPSYLSRAERGQKAASEAVRRRAAAYYEVPQELLDLRDGVVPPDVIRLLQHNSWLLETLRKEFGDGSPG